MDVLMIKAGSINTPEAQFTEICRVPCIDPVATSEVNVLDLC